MDVSESTVATAPVISGVRARVSGKFIYLGKDKFYVRGVTYGTFRPGTDGGHYPEMGAVERDFARMAANGLNAVRTYTVPPRWLLDVAYRHGLYVMVGLPWEQHITFLDDGRRAGSIEERLRAGVRACAGHPAVLCYVIGSEIPASIVRWYGPRRVERYLERLYHAAKDEDPGSLVTYVNYPSTEYLRLPFVDFAAFNVYLEEQENLEAYLRRQAGGHGRDRAGQSHARRGSPGALLGLANSGDVRRRVRRCLRLFLDGRMAPGRLRHRRLGFWAHGQGPATEVRSRDRPPSLR